MSNNEKAYEEWVETVTIDEAMGMGAVSALRELASEMEQYLTLGTVEHLPGTQFWLEQVRSIIRLNDSFHTPPQDDGYITELLEEYESLRPPSQLTGEQKAAAEMEGLELAAAINADRERRERARSN